MIANIMLLDESNLLRIGTKTRLPEAYVNVVDGLAPGPSAGSCGTAVFQKHAVMVDDVMKSSLWVQFRDATATAGIRACWSEPIFSSRNEILGALAMYFPVPQIPTDHDKELMKKFAYLVSIAVERDREQLALQKSERQLRTVTDAMPVLISYIDTDYRFKFKQRNL